MKRYGLIGFPLSHSFSQKFFTDKFAREGIDDCVYEKYPIPDISGLPDLLQSTPGLRGLNVTIPYKEKVIAFLSNSNDIVRATGACNCIDIRNGALTGYNTDAIGFRESLRPHLRPSHRRALVLGKGGAAKAVAYVLGELQIEYLHVVRRAEQDKRCILYTDLDKATMKEHTLIVNTTPVGTFPDSGEAPGIPYQWVDSSHYLYDLVYNPPKTLFLQKGEERGATICNGAEMLVIQAEESWKIWNQ